MGSGNTKFGVPTNPRVELADTETKSLKKRMEIDTPSLIKLSHGTIRYREPDDHRKPKLPRVGKPSEAPHEGKERVSKVGYFYHPKLSDFSPSARYTKEDAARFHYVQRTPAGAHGRKVFFVMGVGMPEEELPPTPPPQPLPEAASVVEDMEVDGDKENVRAETNLDAEVPAAQEADGAAQDAPPAASQEQDQGEKKEKEEEKEEMSAPLEKEFRGVLVPRPRVPRTNELPVRLDRTPIIYKSRSQVYYCVTFTAPVPVNAELVASRTELFRAEAAAPGPSGAQTEGPGPAPEQDGATAVDGGAAEAVDAGTGAAEALGEVTAPDTDAEEQAAPAAVPEPLEDVAVEVLAAGTPPTLGVVFADSVVVADVRQRLGAFLDVSPPKVNLLHEDKYISSQSRFADLAPGQAQEGYRQRVVLTPM